MQNWPIPASQSAKSKTLERMECLHEGNDNAMNERRMKQPKSRCGGHQQRKHASPVALSQPKFPARRRSFNQSPAGLKHQVSRREAVSASGRNGDDQIMNDSRSQESR